MEVRNGQIKDIADGTDLSDGASVNQSSTIYDAGVLTVRKPPYVASATTNGSGQVVLYLTTDGLVGGTPCFTTVKKVSVTINVNNLPLIPKYSLSGVTLTISVTQQTFGTTNFLTTLLGALGLGVNSVTYPAAGSGHPVEVEVIGI